MQSSSAPATRPCRRRRRARTTAAVTAAALILASTPAALSFVPPRHIAPHCQNSQIVPSTPATIRMSLYVDDETAGVAPPAAKPASANPAENTFERRMRNRYLKTSQPRQPKPKQQLPDNVRHVESLSDYRSIIAQSGDRTVVVRFYAKWCKICKSLAPAYYKLARLNPTVTFLDVPVLETNAALHQGLGIPSVPYAYVYYKGVLVEEMKMSRQRFPAFVSKVKMYSRGTCECVGEECDVQAAGEEGGQL
eukprot:CAMPEP_0181031062 /NCGR_PEP_ID=MMETSP1070-20121207/6041_1 /TAXON_ID=265543 /ORGANISM="Minutocellus polymorphus, Strain NH13" /LENGTH=249 /DNA_ID=CAMNT_0023108433 /DNA_START=127 /DNA_END=876 /DNA_ORIENTATION=+